MSARPAGSSRAERKPKTVSVPIVENDYQAADTCIQVANVLIDGTGEYDRQFAELNRSIRQLHEIAEVELVDDFAEVYATAYDGLDWADPNWVVPATFVSDDPGYVTFYVDSSIEPPPIVRNEGLSPA